MARCGCGSSCGCSLTAGDNTVITGSGTAGNPWVIDSHANCTEVRGCLASGAGTVYDPATGSFTVCVSPNAGNQLSKDVNGCLFVPANTNQVITGAGVTGTGSAGDPIRANIRTWPFPCTQDAQGSVVGVDSTGKLVGEPPYHTYFFQLRRTNNFAVGALPVPAGLPISNVDTPFPFVVTNPDPCRPMRLMWKQETRMYVNLPVGSEATTGMNTEEFWAGGNYGTAAIPRNGVYTDKTNEFTSFIGPGASVTLTMQAQAGRAVGTPSIVEIHMSHRVWLFPR